MNSQKYDEFRKAVAEVLNVDISELPDHYSVQELDRLGLDSLDLVELLAEVEEDNL